jgi:hypothetical protein
MKITHKQAVLAAALTSALTLTSAIAQTPDSVQTRIGMLSFERGYPTPETTRKVFDEMDYQRAVQAYLWAYPAVSFESIRLGTKRDLGLDYNEFTIADKLADPKSVWLTANDSTVYALTLIDLGKHGRMVISVAKEANASERMRLRTASVLTLTLSRKVSSVTSSRKLALSVS